MQRQIIAARSVLCRAQPARSRSFSPDDGARLFTLFRSGGEWRARISHVRSFEPFAEFQAIRKSS
jgi:hypothetical protein